MALRVGYSTVEITPPVGVTLADAPLSALVTGKPRTSTHLRDPLKTRALYFEADGHAATLVIADLLLVTEALQAEVAKRAGVAPENLVLAATHTHSGPGSYWRAGAAERIVGRFDAALFDRLAEGIASAARQARESTRSATVSAARARAPGASSNRRRLHGPVDPDLTLVRFAVDGEAPVDLVSFSAHPVIGTERDNGAISADFPGELCRRVESRGSRPVFVQGAVGGLSPLFPEFPMRFDEHLELVGDVLERGYDAAIRDLAEVRVSAPTTKRVRVPLPLPGSTLFPTEWRMRRALTAPLTAWLGRVAKDGRESDDALLHELSLGDVVYVGTPCDLGVTVALEMQRALRERGVRYPIVGSQCGGYVGYVHLPEDYEHEPEKGFREMAFYENVMSYSGRELGRDFVRAMAPHDSARERSAPTA